MPIRRALGGAINRAAIEPAMAVRKSVRSPSSRSVATGSPLSALKTSIKPLLEGSPRFGLSKKLLAILMVK